MNHKIITLALALCAALLLCNCSTVTTSFPLTTKPKAIDKEKFEGVWLFGDDDTGVLQVKFDNKDIIIRLKAMGQPSVS